MKKDINIGLCGLNFSSGNLGCGALAYAFLEIIRDVARKNGLKVTIFVITPFEQHLDKLLNTEIVRAEHVTYRFSNIRNHLEVKKVMDDCDEIFDFTEGDSFTDIYGVKRLISNSFLKRYAISSEAKFTLGPQTFGPFNKTWSRKLAVHIIKKSTKVYARDDQSAEYVKEISGIKAEKVIDVAFALPYTKQDWVPTDKLRVGINVSGLLWNGGYSGNNEFGLAVDYKEYCKTIVGELSKSGVYEIHLIPHVLSEDPREDDKFACEELKKVYPDCVVAPRFSDPMEAKTYIANMDVFTGARMHSTIAAFSTGVATIPFSYSRKFEGLYNTLDYDYCVHGREESTNDAANKTIKYLEDYMILRENVKLGNKIAQKYLQKFKKNITGILCGI